MRSKKSPGNAAAASKSTPKGIALMAETITLSYVNAQGTLTRSKSVPDGSGTRIVSSQKARLKLAANATNAQVFSALADEMFDSLKQNTLNYEREQARATADAGVADMPLT